MANTAIPDFRTPGTVFRTQQANPLAELLQQPQQNFDPASAMQQPDFTTQDTKADELQKAIKKKMTADAEVIASVVPDTPPQPQESIFDFFTGKASPERTENALSVLLPIAAIAESLGTKGMSQGQTALAALGNVRAQSAAREKAKAEQAKLAKEDEMYDLKKQQLQSELMNARNEQELQMKARELLASGATNEEILDALQSPLESAKRKAESEEQKTEIQRKDEIQLRKEFTSASKDFEKVRDATLRVRASAKSPSAAGDLAMIFNYMKVLDPGSTVREGEFATAQNSAGIPERLRAQYNSIISGKRLSNSQRSDFLDRTNRLFGEQASTQQKNIDRYSRLAEKKGIDPEDVIMPIGIPLSAGKANVEPEYPTPATEAEYNALPSGTIYIDPDDGKQYKKP